jgi:hypothetical protein
MNIITQKYTILCYRDGTYTQTFSIKFDKETYPKDIFDHNDAVEDYLTDTNQNTFEPIPEVIEVTIHEPSEK